MRKTGGTTAAVVVGSPAAACGGAAAAGEPNEEQVREHDVAVHGGGRVRPRGGAPGEYAFGTPGQREGRPGGHRGGPRRCRR
ncbi:hypothetical protein [Umezawaea tangerina]|uniref:Uncharacterized protein n=1 Tax=Umezawaea tangerina TaxID=84725 RepID=A0A2T0TME7_9PSEU|nr:hypothetical protein [Umezawaea tangerina]PRY46829.1 hypothetical protein CLV43_1011110 [Umezawaea tangerina]